MNRAARWVSSLGSALLVGAGLVSPADLSLGARTAWAQPSGSRARLDADVAASERDAASRIAASSWSEAIKSLEKSISLREQAHRSEPRTAPLLLVLEYAYRQAGAKDKADQTRARFDREFDVKSLPAAGPARTSAVSKAETLRLALQDVQRLFDEEHAFAAADTLYEKDLALAELTMPNRKSLASVITRIGERYRLKKGDFVGARALLERATSMYTQDNIKDADAAFASNALGCLYIDIRDYDRAEPVFERAQEIWAKIAPDNLAVAFNNLAIVAQNRGELERAQEMYEKALSMWERQLGEVSENVAISLMNLGTVARRNEDYARAEQRFSRSLEIREQTKPQEATLAALGLANTFAELGQNARAEEMFTLAIERATKKGGDNHVDVARVLEDRGDYYWDMGTLDKAEKDLRRALEIRDKTTGATSMSSIGLHSSLGRVLIAKGSLDEAEQQLAQALSLEEKTDGPEHLDVADELFFLANCHWVKGDFSKAIAAYERAREIRRKALAEQSPFSFMASTFLSVARWSSGDTQGALKDLADASRGTEPMVAPMLSVATEARRGRVWTSLEMRLSLALSLHFSSKSDDSSRFALLSSLRVKQRYFDSLVDAAAPWRRTAGSSEMGKWVERSKLRAKLGRDLIDGPARALPASYRERLSKRQSDIDAIESALPSERRAVLASMDDDSVERLFAKIGDGTLVDYVRFDPIDPSKKTRAEQIGAARYAALVVRNKKVSVFDLGEAKTIDALVLKHRASLGSASSNDAQKTGRDLDERIWAPIEEAVRGASSIIVCPDGALSQVAFSALVDAQQKWRIESISFRYASSLRALLRARPASSDSGSLLDVLAVAQPKLDLGASSGGFKTAELSAPPVVVATKFAPLRTTPDAPAYEVFKSAKVLLGPDASEADLKRAPAAKVVHLDAPSFALSDETKDAARLRMFEGLPGTYGSTSILPRSTKRQNPAFVTGLGLSGANLVQQGDDSGILGAIEMAGLPWSSSELVVIPRFSAASGDPQRTAGLAVSSLREAVAISGARSLLHSLWVAPETSINAMLTDVYRSISSGKARSEALRSTQLKLLQSPATAHPHHWASLTLVGEDGPVATSSAVPISLPKTQKPHACGCELPGDSGPLEPGAIALLTLGLVGLVARRRDAQE
ncbi:MAG: CHAT domain-containing tetratricopeptide repeat protein [Polyangiaceae bacterium]